LKANHNQTLRGHYDEALFLISSKNPPAAEKQITTPCVVVSKHYELFLISSKNPPAAEKQITTEIPYLMD